MAASLDTAMPESTPSATHEPLQITSLVNLSACNRNEQSAMNAAATATKSTGTFHVLQRILSAHPFLNSHWVSDCDNDTSIETVLEVWKSGVDDTNDNDSGDETSWMRVAVYSGPDGHQSLHSSYQLPADAHPPVVDISTSSCLCWAAFPEQPNHPLLCVLVSGAAVCLWDVYPAQDYSMVTGGDGWTVSLPFDCCGIHAIGDSGGLLLQRLEDIEDFQHQQQRKLQQDHPMHHAGAAAADEEDGFFLKAPPKLARLMTDNSNPAAPTVWTPPPPQQQQEPNADFGAITGDVSSLFSLQHPLADILPVSELLTGAANVLLNTIKPVTDVLEKVIWVGTARWTSADATSSSSSSIQQCNEQMLMVTYHTVKQRHAVWLIQDAPPPAETPPLWQRSRQWREAAASTGADNSADWNLMRHEDDTADLVAAAEFLEDADVDNVVDPVMPPPPSVSRTDALAEALGVRRQQKTPRKSAAAASREIRSHPRKSAASEAHKQGHQQQTSFFSPRTNQSLSATSTAALHETAADASAGMIEPSLGPFASMHSKIAVTCVFKDAQVTACAEQVFLVSNLEASGTLVLSVVCEGNEDGSKDLRLYGLVPLKSGAADGSFTFQVEPAKSLLCMAAQPVQATPVPACFYPQPKDRRGFKTMQSPLATDLLVLTRSAETSKLSLYRANVLVVDCALPVQEGLGAVLDLTDGIKDRVSLHWQHSTTAVKSVRGKCSLAIPFALSERVLSVIDAALFAESRKAANTQLGELALKIRADCARLAQSLSRSTEASSHLTDAGWLAVETLLNAIVERELLGKMNLMPDPSSQNAQGDAWNMLLGSSFHQSYMLDSGDSLFLGSPGGANKVETGSEERSLVVLDSISSLSIESLNQSGLQIVAHTFDALHLLYEDCKISMASSGDIFRLASLLVRTCRVGKVSSPDNLLADRFLDHYRQDLGDETYKTIEDRCPTAVAPFQARPFSSGEAPASFSRWAARLMRAKRSATEFYDVVETSEINASCFTTRSLHRILKVIFAASSATRASETVSALLEEGFTDVSMIQEQLPSGIALPILEVLYQCRCDPSAANGSEWPAEAWVLVGRDDLSRNMLSTGSRFETGSVPLSYGGEKSEETEDKDNDGLAPLERSAAMLFPDDNRIREAARLLRSSRPMFLRLNRAVEVSDHDYEKQKQSKLLLLCRRALALPIGRGMLTLGSLRPVAAEPLPLPEIVLKGKIPPTNALLALDKTSCPPDMTVWPEFHNGVAAGLRLPLAGDASESDFKITRTWIVYNRPVAPPTPSNEDGNDTPPTPNQKSHAHGGLLLALGLRGHLTALEMSDLYEYLTQGTVTTTVGVLLGMAANKRGTCDMAVSKMLCLHIPSLIPQHFSAIDVASPVQTAAVTGAGLLFQRSSHRMMTEFLLNEIGKRPDSDISAFDREAYVLSCGLALGMVNLCLGERSSDIDRAGGIADLRVEERLYRYVVGGVDRDETRRTRESNDRFSLPSSAQGGDNEKCSVISEGDSINTDVTAPGAVLALGLMYMKTGNQTIASAIALPDTHFLLEFVRPDFLAHRIVSRTLILWNEVQPSQEWINGQIPSVVRNAYAEMRTTAKNNMEGHSAGSKTRKQPDYDRRAVRQIYVHTLTGACMGLGLRFAGTSDTRVADALFERIFELHTMREANDGVSVASRPEFPILETCLGSIAISLAMVLAGTGDLEAFKLFKILRWRCDGDIKYGSHAVYGMAIGLLFLGGGTCTLGREPEDLAALVTAFFPRYPRKTADNQCHLQALRHLYALAVKRKELCAVDVDTGERVSVAVDVRSAGSMTPQRLTLPCLLLNSLNSDSPWDELRVVSDKYYPVQLNLQTLAPRYTFFVKKRSVRLDHFPFFAGQKAKNMAALVRPLTENPLLLAYAHYFCYDDITRPGTDMAAGWGDSRVLLESLPAEEALFLYLTLNRTIAAMQQSMGSTLTLTRSLSNLQLIRSYLQDHVATRRPAPTLLNPDLLAYLHERTERLLAAKLQSSSRQSVVSGAVVLYDA